MEDNGVVIAICGGYQLLGKYYKTDQGNMKGLDLVDLYTEQGEGRLIQNIVLQSELFDMPIVGFENHGGRTCINNNKPLGKVLYGAGNDGKSGYEGVVYKNVIGTYLHGPLLPKNPQLADWLIQHALERKYGKETELTQAEKCTSVSKEIIKPVVPRKLHCIKPFFKFFYAVCSLYERPEHHRRSGGNNNQQYPIVMPIHFKARFAVCFFILSSSFRSNLSFGSQTVKIKATRAQSASIPAS